MGNQGMTNWKFSAFFAIALILVAGMFASTAIAADGDGTVTGRMGTDVGIRWLHATTPFAGKVYSTSATDGSEGNAATGTVPLVSGSVENEVQFTYTVLLTDAIDMNGGAVPARDPQRFHRE